MDKLHQIKDLIIITAHKGINFYNKQRLTNHNPTIISSDCSGGIISKWLRLEFNSPFINLYLNNEDFLCLLENFDEFIESDIIEDLNSDKPYPVGIGCHGERINFMHYPDFATAMEKWNIRKKRINHQNMGILLSNLGEGLENKEETRSILLRFWNLPFKHKIVLSGEDTFIEDLNVIKLKGFEKRKHGSTCYYNSFGRRYIDTFDYVGFINSLNS